MEMRDPVVIKTSLKEVVGSVREAIKTKDLNEMHEVLSLLGKELRSMPGHIYLALNKGTVDQLSNEERFLAEAIQLKDTLQETIDAAY
jgi:hypothetical protein